MDSSDSNDDSYQKDSLLDLLTKQKTGRTHQDNRISIDFANQVMTLGLYKPPKQLYIQNTCHTKEIHVSVIKEIRERRVQQAQIFYQRVYWNPHDEQGIISRRQINLTCKQKRWFKECIIQQDEKVVIVRIADSKQNSREE